MEIKEAVEYLKNGKREHEGVCENVVIVTMPGEKWEAICMIGAALENGYTLCKVDEAVEKMDKICVTQDVKMCIEILKEACK